MNLRKFERNLKKEYNETFKENKPKFVFTFKLRHAFALIAMLFGIVLLSDYAVVTFYNNKLAKEREEIYNINETAFVKIENKIDYKNIIGLKKEKETLFSKIIDNLIIVKYTNDVEAELAGSDSVMAPKEEYEIEDSTNTNVQVVGIDEADYSKCDGKYIYTIYNRNLLIFDLEGNKIVESQFPSYINGLYIYENKLIVIGSANTIFYEFDGTKLIELNSFNYMIYNDSRLTDNYFYLVYNNKFDRNNEYSNMYYDQASNANRVYSIIRFDLTTNEFKEVNNLNSGNVTLYMSDKHIYLATIINVYAQTYNQMTVTSIFDHDLNPVAALRVKGTVLNQFSMDEYDKYFRIVTTNTARENERLNAISIFDLESKTLIGYLDEGIGLERQTVKSVRFDDTTCYVVTYFTSDPLYEIDLKDPTKPTIVSIYQSPGYSSYLHSFKINGESYLFGIGYCDDQHSRKISVYKNDDETTQIGKDLIISDYYVSTEEQITMVYSINYFAFNDHRALFIYQKNDILYLGLKVTPTEYYFFKIDVSDEENTISIYEKITLNYHYNHSRCYLVNGKIYITDGIDLFIKNVVE